MMNTRDIYSCLTTTTHGLIRGIFIGGIVGGIYMLIAWPYEECSYIETHAASLIYNCSYIKELIACQIFNCTTDDAQTLLKSEASTHTLNFILKTAGIITGTIAGIFSLFAKPCETIFTNRISVYNHSPRNRYYELALAEAEPVDEYPRELLI